MSSTAKKHWEQVYSSKDEAQLSWHQRHPVVSLELCETVGVSSTTSFIDIGGGTSSLARELALRGVNDITVLDISSEALSKAKLLVKDLQMEFRWLRENIVLWKPDRKYTLWHDRAVFHFLVDEPDRQAYLSHLNEALGVGGHAIIATFAPDGPDQCSGLPIQKYSPTGLADVLGPNFDLIEHKDVLHETPWGSSQAFQYSLFKKIN